MSVVSKVIFNPFHYGLIRHDRALVKGIHYPDRILDQEIYDRLLELKASKRKFPTNTASCDSAVLAGLVRCEACGERLYVVHPRGSYRSYRCGYGRIGAPRCPSRPNVRGEFLEPQLIARIEKIALEPDVQELAFLEAQRLLQQNLMGRDQLLSKLDEELQNLRERQERHMELYEDGQLSKDVLIERSQKLALARSECEARMASLKDAVTENRQIENEIAQLKSILMDFPHLWSKMTPDERRTALDALIESLTVDQQNGKIQVNLKLRMLPLVEFELPVVGSWSRNGQGRRPLVTLRQLAYLKEVADGNSFEDIQIKWGVGRSNLNNLRRKALDALGARTIEEAIQKAQPMLQEWEPYLRTKGRFGGSRYGEAGPKPLTCRETETLKLIAAGWLSADIAKRFGVPVSTVEGIRARIREKLLAHSTEEMVHRATKLGLIGPDDPSPSLLLRIYRAIADGKHDSLVAKGLIKQPSPLQLEMLEDLVTGVEAQETAERRRVSLTAIVTARKRMWAVVGGTDLKTALEKATELGLVPTDQKEVTHA